jgi:hypothetical protein
VASVESRNLDQPDESRTPDKTEVNVVSVGGNEVGRFTFQPAGGGRSASSPSPAPTAAR